MTTRVMLVALTMLGPLLGLPSVDPAGSVYTRGPVPSTYTARLAPVPLNGASATGADGVLTLTLQGTTAHITEDVHRLAAIFESQPYPHLQQIHGLRNGICPTVAADANNDGVISGAEAEPQYGPALTTLSMIGDTSPATATNARLAPTGSSYHYSRTIPLNSRTMEAIRDGTAVIVIDGLDPATTAPSATTRSSVLAPALPLEVTAPALCGALIAG